MKVLTSVAASIVVGVGLVAAPAADVAAAEACPTECRREVAEVICRLVVTEGDGTRLVTRYYYSNGAD